MLNMCFIAVLIVEGCIYLSLRYFKTCCDIKVSTGLNAMIEWIDILTNYLFPFLPQFSFSDLSPKLKPSEAVDEFTYLPRFLSCLNI